MKQIDKQINKKEPKGQKKKAKYCYHLTKLARVAF